MLRFRTLTLAVGALVFAGACGGGGSTGATGTPAPAGSSASPSTVETTTTTTLPLTTLATAAKWVAAAADATLTSLPTPPQQITDPSSQKIGIGSGELSGLDFQGAAVQNYARMKVDPALKDPRLVPANYIVKAFVFGSAADAVKFRDLEAARVLNAGSLKQADTYADGVVLQDGTHVNVFFTIGNVGIMILSGLNSNVPAGVAVADAKLVADAVAAGSQTG